MKNLYVVEAEIIALLQIPVEAKNFDEAVTIAKTTIQDEHDVRDIKIKSVTVE